MKCAAAIILLFALASVASARPVGLRSLLSDEHEPVYCPGPDDHDKCPEHFECVALEEEVCKPVRDCTTDDYGTEKCTYDQKCWEYVCEEVPKYCKVVSYGHEDECKTKYGKEYECKELKKEECVYDKECKYVDTDECKKYEYETICTEVDTKICLKYNKEHKCDKKKVCKEYKEEKKCKPGQKKCTKYEYGQCTEYGKGEEDCEYVKTDECEEYEYKKGHCKYVNTTCKEYKKDKICKKVKKECIEYEEEEECEDVKVCWKGKCIEVPEKKGYTFGK